MCGVLMKGRKEGAENDPFSDPDPTKTSRPHVPRDPSSPQVGKKPPKYKIEELLEMLKNCSLCGPK
jgi:hypothetical protein